MNYLKVIEKETRTIYEVYDITYDNLTKEPLFLIYDGGMWTRRRAKDFDPVDEQT